MIIKNVAQYPLKNVEIGRRNDRFLTVIQVSRELLQLESQYYQGALHVSQYIDLCINTL